MKRLALALGLLAGALSSARAANISIQTRITTHVEGEVLVALVQATNQGDEPAMNVQMRAEVAGTSDDSPLVQTLPVGKSVTHPFRFSIGQLPPGRHPLLVRTSYADTNLYAFSALSSALFVHRQDAPSPLLVKLDTPEIRGKGQITMVLRNPTGARISARFWLEVPQELSTDAQPREVVLAPGSEKSLRFKITNFSALPGSAYVLFGVVQYDADGLRHTVLASSLTRIGASTASPQNYLYILFGIVFVVLLIINVPAWKKKRN